MKGLVRMTPGQFLMAALIAAAAFVLPTAVMAGDEVTPAPRVELRGQMYDITIWIRGSASRSSELPDMLRLPQPKIDLEEWLLGYDDLLSAFQADPVGSFNGRAALEIDATGSVSTCAFRDGTKLHLPEDELCSELGKIAFYSALDKSGKPAPGAFSLSLFTERNRVEAGAPRIPIMGSGAPTLYAARSPAPLLDPYSFPPSPEWMRRFYEQPQWDNPPATGWQEPSQQAAIVGLVLAWDGANYRCLAKENSGSDADRMRACDYAQRHLAPTWPSVSPDNPRAVPLYIFLAPGEEPVALAPLNQPRSRTIMEGSVETEFLTRLYAEGLFPHGREASGLRLHLSANPDGSLGHCRVAKTTGSDAMDIKACQIAYDTVTLSVSQNIFGKPAKFRSLFWDARTED